MIVVNAAVVEARRRVHEMEVQQAAAQTAQAHQVVESKLTCADRKQWRRCPGCLHWGPCQKPFGRCDDGRCCPRDWY